MPETTTSQTTSRTTCAVVNPATGELVEEAEGAYGPLSSWTADEGAEMPFGGVKRSGFGRELGPRTGPRDQLRQALRSQHAGRVRAGGREVRRPLPRQGVAPAHQHQVARVPARAHPRPARHHTSAETARIARAWSARDASPGSSPTLTTITPPGASSGAASS
ncbi:hypothetical protein [Kocuria sp. cx-455]|uniref:hypothetical protein n=1 Tax=Kocuria sp. cx-455 TaxID=2771377 RepID=UPI003D7396AB